MILARKDGAKMIVKSIKEKEQKTEKEPELESEVILTVEMSQGEFMRISHLLIKDCEERERKRES